VRGAIQASRIVGPFAIIQLAACGDSLNYFYEAMTIESEKANGFVVTCGAGYLYLAQRLLEKDPTIDINVQDPHRGMTALIAAASTGSLHVVKYLLCEKGADLSRKDFSGYDAMGCAVCFNFVNVAALLVEKGASCDGCVEVVEPQHVAAAPLQQQNVMRRIPYLLLAAQSGFTEMVKFLLDSQPKVSAITPTDDETASTKVNDTETPQVHQMQMMTGKSDAFEAATGLAATDEDCSNGAAVAASRVEGGSEHQSPSLFFVNIQDSCGYTALMKAATGGHTSCMKLLIERGADVAMKQENGGCALRFACEFGNLDAVSILIDAGADPLSSDSQNSSVLHSAAAFGHTEIVKLLLSLGTDPTQKDNEGNTPLSDASNHEVKKLISQAICADYLDLEEE
jgi:ankyrin repeat protein